MSLKTKLLSKGRTFPAFDLSNINYILQKSLVAENLQFRWTKTHIDSELQCKQAHINYKHRFANANYKLFFCN